MFAAFLFIVNIVGFHTHTLASTSEELWKDWKKKTYQDALESPTSFLNAYALKQGPANSTFFLVVGEGKRDTYWDNKKPQQSYASAEHLGDRVRIKVQDRTLGYLDSSSENSRREFKLPNGHYAEVVLGKRNNKLWVYLYNPKQIDSFTGFRFYPFNPSAVVEGFFKAQTPKFVSYKTVQGDPTKVYQIGNVSFELYGKEFFLPAYNWQISGEPFSYFELIYTDNSKGKTTYGGGRGLKVESAQVLKDGQKVTLDFNRTANFYCAHSPFWHCPVGLQKHLNIEVKAGEMLPLKKLVQ